jgi:hypothetical protein
VRDAGVADSGENAVHVASLSGVHVGRSEIDRRQQASHGVVRGSFSIRPRRHRRPAKPSVFGAPNSRRKACLSM